MAGLMPPLHKSLYFVLSRKMEDLIKIPEEYIEKIKETIRNADKFYLIRQLQD